MKPQEIQQTIERLIPVIMEALRQFEIEHACIQASSLLAKTLHLLGVPEARLLTVRVQVFNNAGAMVYVGQEMETAPKGRWAGHLVVVVPNGFEHEHILIDLTIPQANQPDWEIKVEPMFLRVDDGFLSGNEAANITAGEIQLSYSAYPNDLSYNSEEDCMTKEGLETVAQDVIRSMPT